MKVGVLFNIDIYISKMMLLMMVVAVLIGEGAKLAVFFVIIFVHETAHVIMARFLDLSVKEIELLPFGGAVRIETLFELSPRHEALVAAAGPLSNIALIMGYLTFRNLNLLNLENHDLFVQANLAIAGFNLLPVLPLDGGRILRAALSREMGIKKATRITAFGGFLLALLLVMIGLYALYYRIFNPTLFVTAGFLVYSAVKERRMAAYIILRDITYKKDVLLKEGILPVKEITVLYDVAVKDVIKKFIPRCYHYVAIVDEQFRFKGRLSEADIVGGLMEHGLDTPVLRLIDNKRHFR
ncbi:MAG: peptidase M50 [Clostridiales bacterium]|jgi:stage IV sporulation protein FB|nr:peptidase M50 [Clostridiales bacterium]